MRTVAQAFEAFASSLELTEKQRAEAERQRDVVKAHLLHGLSVKQDFISGSFGRNTAIRPLKDIDLFLTLEPRKHADLREGSPDACLRAIYQVLAQAYPNKEPPRLQRRSVNVEFQGTGIGFDVVPAFQDPDNPDVYHIPDRGLGLWIRSNPRLHKEHSSRANDVAGKKAKPLVKMLKCWNRSVADDKPLRSFHLEIMVYDVLRTPPIGYAQGLADLFEALAARVMSPCPDPAGLGPAIDAGLTPAHRARARGLLREAADLARQALEAARDGRTEEAHYHWRKLLGNEYPEPGKAPAPRGTPGSEGNGHTRRGPDAPDRRFG